MEGRLQGVGGACHRTVLMGDQLVVRTQTDVVLSLHRACNLIDGVCKYASSLLEKCVAG